MYLFTCVEIFDHLPWHCSLLLNIYVTKGDTNFVKFRSCFFLHSWHFTTIKYFGYKTLHIFLSLSWNFVLNYIHTSEASISFPLDFLSCELHELMWIMKHLPKTMYMLSNQTCMEVYCLNFRIKHIFLFEVCVILHIVFFYRAMFGL